MEGWETERLGDACELITRGVAPKYLAGGGLCVLNQRCVRDHSIDYSFARRHDHTTKPVKTDRIIKVGDVLVNSTGTGTLGRVAQVRQEPPEPTTVDTHVTIVRPKPGRFHPDFFGYIAISIEDQLAASGEGASGQTELSRTAIADKFQISYPRSLPEQQRIVAILDEAFEGIDKAIANTKQTLANARDLFESQLENSFREKLGVWPEVPLRSICERVSVGHVGPTSQFYCEPADGIPFARSQNVRPGLLDTDDIRFITAEFHNKLKKSQLKSGDLLFVRVGANRADCCSVPKGIGEMNCANIVFARPCEGVVRFLEYFCRSKTGREQLLGMTTGSAQGVINTRSVAELMVPFPPVSEQTNTVESLDDLFDATGSLVAAFTKTLGELQALKVALLEAAFSGRLHGGQKRLEAAE